MKRLMVPLYVQDPKLASAILGAVCALLFAPFAVLPYAIWAPGAPGAALLAASASASALVYAGTFMEAAHLKSGLRHAALAPLGALVVVAGFAAGILRARGRDSVSWRGRRTRCATTPSGRSRCRRVFTGPARAAGREALKGGVACRASGIRDAGTPAAANGSGRGAQSRCARACHSADERACFPRCFCPTCGELFSCSPYRTCTGPTGASWLHRTSRSTWRSGCPWRTWQTRGWKCAARANGRERLRAFICARGAPRQHRRPPVPAPHGGQAVAVLGFAGRVVRTYRAAL